MFFEENNAMLMQAKAAPALIKEYIDILKEEVRFTLSVEETYQVKDLYMIGSGDSLISAKAACLAFSELAHVDAHALSSLEASRYLARGYMPSKGNHSLVIAISNSGETSRVVEAAKWFKKTDATLIAVTSKTDSTLAEICGKTICTKIPPFQTAPEVRSFEINLLALYMLAIRMGENKGVYTMDHAGELRRDLAHIADAIPAAMERSRDVLMNMAKLCVENDEVEFVGSGPAKGAAEFGMAKVIEATGTGTLAQEWEEFAHVNFFRRAPDKIPTVLIYPSCTPAMSRLEELIRLLEHIGRPYIVITDTRDSDDPRFVQTGEVMNELFMPLYATVMIGQMVAYMNMFIDEDYYRGHLGVWDESEWHVNLQSKIE